MTSASVAPTDSPAFTGTPTGITKAHVGLPLVDNTADINKPVSGPQAAAIVAGLPHKVLDAPTGDATIDTPPIVAALAAAASAAGGGVVIGRPGTYLVNQRLEIASHVGLVGCGRDLTTFRAANGLNDDVIATVGFDSLTGTDPVTNPTTSPPVGPRGFILRDFTVDGNRDNQTVTPTARTGGPAKGNCMSIYGSDYEAENIRCIYGNVSGFYSEFSTGVGVTQAHGVETKLSHLTCHYNNLNGFDWNGPHDAMADRVIAFGNSNIGINVGSGGSGLQISDSHSWGTIQQYAWQVNDAVVSAHNCEAEGAILGQVLILQGKFSWIGGNVFTVSPATNPGIIIGDTSNAVSHCVIKTRISGCETGALVINHDNGDNDIELLVNQVSGTKIVGTPSTTTHLRIVGNEGTPVEWDQENRVLMTGFLMERAGGTQNSMRTRVSGDTDWRYYRRTDGTMRWGDGTNPPDVQWYRSAAGVLATDGSITAVGSIQAGGQAKLFGGVRLTNSATVTANTTLTGTSPGLIEVDASGGAVIISLYGTATVGLKYQIVKIDTSANAVTVSPGGPIGATINGSTSSLSLTHPGDVAHAYSTGTIGVWVGETVVTAGPTVNWMKPTAAVRSNISRTVGMTNIASALVGGTLRMSALELVQGDLVSFLSFCAGTTAAGSPTNQWFALYDASLNLLGVTADDTSTAWNASAIKKLAMASPYRVTTSGFYYIGCVVVATTVPTLSGISGIQGIMSQAPIMTGSSTASLTNPASAPSTAGALTVNGNMPWVQAS